MCEIQIQVCGVTMRERGRDEDGKLLVPLTELAELLSLELRMQPEHRRVLLERRDVNICIDDVYIDGGCLLDDTAYAPVDAVAEALGAGFHWDPDQRLMEICS